MPRKLLKEQVPSKHTFRSYFLTGLVALLPISLFILVVTWLYRLVDGVIEPIARLYGTPGIITNGLVLLTLIFVIFLVGLAARTRLGQWVLDNLEKNVFLHLPGYRTIKELVKPFTGESYKQSLKSVALVDVFGNGSLMSAFITDRHGKHTTVFIPTGPNPTSGNIVHLPKERVYEIDASVDKVLRTVISAGAGSKDLLAKVKKTKLKK
ncbi:MAG: DUF502 domain-containing protein [Candidatus Woesearchaeota archaeon]